MSWCWAVLNSDKTGVCSVDIIQMISLPPGWWGVDRIKVTKCSALVVAHFKQSMEMCLSQYSLKRCHFFNLLVGCSVLRNEIRM